MSVLLRLVPRKRSVPELLWDAEITEHILPLAVTLEVDDQASAPSAQMSGWAGHVGTALLPASAEDMERDRELAEVKEDLRVHLNLASEHVRKLSMARAMLLR